MWKIIEHKRSEPLLDHFEIFNENIRAKIYPKLGASLQAFRVGNTDIIDGIPDENEGLEEYRLTYKSSVLCPFPNRVDAGKYGFDQQTHQLDINEKALNNAIHGLVYNQDFHLVEDHMDPQQASLLFRYDYKGDAPGYPFPYRLDLKYSFDKSGQLKMHFKVQNQGSKGLPIGLGWHPYFAVPELSEAHLEMKALKVLEVDQRMIPTEETEAKLETSIKVGEQFFDTAYILESGRCALSTKAYKATFEFGSPSGAYLQVYTPPHRKSIAIEPMTCVADSFNNKMGLIRLEGGEELEWEISVKVEES